MLILIFKLLLHIAIFKGGFFLSFCSRLLISTCRYHRLVFLYFRVLYLGIYQDYWVYPIFRRLSMYGRLIFIAASYLIAVLIYSLGEKLTNFRWSMCFILCFVHIHVWNTYPMQGTVVACQNNNSAILSTLPNPNAIQKLTLWMSMCFYMDCNGIF